ncbi:MAG TPA: methionyl-tRNA formyltransferase [Anaerolineae bacterium]|nr:methionyl-tRNA formyltransferase [Anaerolineae bacterium]
MGSPAFALPSLRLLDEDFDVIGVVTQPDKPAGRGKQIKQSAVKVFSLSQNLFIMQPRRLKDQEFIENLRKLNPDVIVVAAFGQILPQAVLDLPEMGCINVHASLLPRWRGAAPIQAAILHGDQQTGVTIMKMDAGIDTGTILSQKEVDIFIDDTSDSLSKRLAELGANLLVKVLPKYVRGDIQTQVQDDDFATYAIMIKKEDGLLNFQLTAKEIERKIRAYYPWPGAYTYFWEKLLKIHSAHISLSIGLKSGQRGVIEKKPVIGTKDGTIVLDEVQLAGKKSMKGEDFLMGARNWTLS